MKDIIEIFKKSGLEIGELEKEKEGQEYHASSFNIGGKKVIYRKSKITPKKIGQFVTFWKRNSKGITEPFSENDDFDFYVVNSTQNFGGLFIFPKDVLVKKSIIKTDKKDGKRGFRVYPKWDIPKNKQAITAQSWQLGYFFELENERDMEKIKEIFYI